MLAEARKDDKMAISWEKKFVEFVSYNGMPEIGTPLYNWKYQQLSNTHASCLNAKIQKELAENEGRTIWRERRVKLSDCVEQKNRAKMGIGWEKKFVEFVSYNGMPEIGTPLYNWQSHQLSNTHASCLNAKIREELAENGGRTIWRERRVKLSDCVEQKNRAKMSIGWEKKFTEFVSYDGMPERGTPLYNWQSQQLGNEAYSLNAKIQKELAENEGSIWRERRVKLANCVEQKRRE
jgi:Zn ribbon nucleic-acid-binding protein